MFQLDHLNTLPFKFITGSHKKFEENFKEKL